VSTLLPNLLVDFFSNFPTGLATGVLVALITLIGKYLLDYRLESRRLQLQEKAHGSEDERARWQLQAEARQEVYTVVGSTQSSFVRAGMELHDRLSNYLQHADRTRTWLRPCSSLADDGYYLREFMRRLFNFYSWGRIAQDSINSLPVELVQERHDLQRLYTFVNLANAILSYTWLFKGIDHYEDTSENLHLFTGRLALLTEMGASIWRENSEIGREHFDDLYNNSVENTFLTTLRDLLVATYAEDDAVQKPNRRAAFVIARLSVLRATVGAYLSLDHAWALALHEDEPVSRELDFDLNYAMALMPDRQDLPQLVRRNVTELMHRYRCMWLPLDLQTSSSEDASSEDAQ
jgi:hypothetical protein